MSEWWTYSLTDFLLFSPRTYYRLFELYNAAIWPAHVAAVALGLAILLSARRNDGRPVAAILGGLWIWTALAFHLDRYATINWAAIYVAGVFAFQAGLLLWTGVARNKLDITPPRRAADYVGPALFLFALCVQPTIGPLLGRSWTQVEMFGLAPDPTAVATLGILLMGRHPHWHLLVVPLLWCAFTGLTLSAMEAPDALVSPIAAALALIVAAWKTVHVPRAAHETRRR